MPKLVKDGAVAVDDWRLLRKIDDATQLAQRNIIVPGSHWLQARTDLANRDDVGIWLNGDDELAPYAEYIAALPLIAVHFPGFMDGRGFSTARLLRERFQFNGELRAIGHFMRDQLTYLRRCGFNAFSFDDNVDLDGALKSLNDFSEYYQAAVDQPLPLFRRRG